MVSDKLISNFHLQGGHTFIMIIPAKFYQNQTSSLGDDGHSTINSRWAKSNCLQSNELSWLNVWISIKTSWVIIVSLVYIYQVNYHDWLQQYQNIIFSRFSIQKHIWPRRKIDQGQPSITSQTHIVDPTFPSLGSLNLRFWRFFFKVLT